ncbi:MAG: thioredoxin, partial [Thermoplasmata archaeon]|nr:thioredoxin [Thermoplasmata archaeon]
FGKLNTDENQGIAMKFNVMSIPTFLVFKNGELIDRPVGAMPKPALEQALNKYLE